MTFEREAVPFSTLVGKTFSQVVRGKEHDEEYIRFINDTETYSMHHDHDCCEGVTIDDICGDLHDLEGVPILSAEVVTSDEDTPQEAHPPKSQDGYTDTSYTWTF